MANPLFESLYGGNAQRPSGQAPANIQDAMSALKSNPAVAIRQAGYQVPDEMANDPKSIVTYLIQSGQVSNPMLQRIRPLLNQMMGR